MTVNTYQMKKLAAAALCAALMSAPAAMLAADTASMVPGIRTAQESAEKIAPISKAETVHGVSVSNAWMRQVRLGGVLVNLRLHTPLGDEITFRERLVRDGVDFMHLHLIASSDSEVIAMQLDQEAVETLERLGITQVVVADKNCHVRARYQVSELRAVREALALSATEQLCVSGENASVTVVNEDGVRRQVNP